MQQTHKMVFLNFIQFHVYSKYYLTDQILSNKNSVMESDNNYYFVNSADACNLPSWTLISAYLG